MKIAAYVPGFRYAPERFPHPTIARWSPGLEVYPCRATMVVDATGLVWAWYHTRERVMHLGSVAPPDSADIISSSCQLSSLETPADREWSRIVALAEKLERIGVIGPTVSVFGRHT